MKNLIFDLETDGLLPEVSKIHYIVIKELDKNDRVRTYTRESHRLDGVGTIEDGLQVLAGSEMLVCHNIIAYDIPVIQKLYPGWRTNACIRDTLVISRLYYTELKRFDYSTRPDLPSKLMGSHSLEAWGHRLGQHKEHTDIEDWSVPTPEMLERCISDVKLNEVLWKKLKQVSWSEESVQLEHDVASIIQMQETAGVKFDTTKAGLLYADLLKEQENIGSELRSMVPGWYKDKGIFTPKVNNRKQGYTKGCVLNKLEWISFNPQSRQHLIRVLKEKHGWKPKKFTNAGNAMLDESVLKGLSKIPGADKMWTYLTISKRISQLMGGKRAWLKEVTREGFIHGRVNPMGTITGRMSHYSPNLSQVPAVYSPYGKECRELFTVREPGNYLVGADADGLELRCLAHYLHVYDGGKYADAVLHGNKEEETSAHFLTLKALGSLCKSYDTAKTFFYALIYGAQDWKLGSILTGRSDNRNTAVGKAARARVEIGIRGLGKLRSRIERVLKERYTSHKRKWLTGLDGRRIYIRSEHAALNSLLQSAGGVIMKKALVILNHDLIKELNYEHGKDFWYLINSHDEWQLETTSSSWAAYIGERMCWAMEEAGKYYKLKVPITGEYKVGKNWSQTH